MTDDKRKEKDRRTPTFHSEAARLKRMWTGQADRRKGGERRRSYFSLEYTVTLEGWGEFADLAQYFLGDCNSGQKFDTVQSGYRDIEERMEYLRARLRFLTFLIGPEKNGEDYEIRKQHALVNGLERMTEIMFCKAMDVYGACLRQREVEKPTEDAAEAESPKT